MATIVAGGLADPRVGHSCVMPAQSPALAPVPAPRQPSGPYRICLVCLGNICRSPMAEVVLRDELDLAGLSGRVVVDSAGTGDWHIGDQMDRRARAELSRRGYDGSAHRARQIEASWLPGYDLIVAMDFSNKHNMERMASRHPGTAGRIRLLRSFDPDAAGAEVPDPYSGGPQDYADAFDLVLPAARVLAGQLARELPAPS
jgi:protein-tyrosine phosphatase